MSLRQLLPLLEVVGTANKHINKVSKFMNKYGDLNMFPVKVQIPIIMTVYALLSFKHFKVLTRSDNIGPDFFAVPKDYTRKRLDQVVQQLEAKSQERELAAAAEQESLASLDV